MTKAELIRIQQTYQRRKMRYAASWTAPVFLALRKEKAKILRYMAKNGLLLAYTDLNRIIDGSEIEKVINRLYNEIMPKEAASLYRSLYKTKDARGFGTNEAWIEIVNEWIQRNILDQVVRPITQTAIKEISKILQEIIVSQGSYDEAVKAIQSTTTLDRVRARLIARTETNRAMNVGHAEGAQKLPFYTNKTWLAAQDNRTRGAEGDDKADHYHMNGQNVAENEPFTDPRSGKQLMFPGDSSLGAGAADICNCRCSSAYVGKRDANGRLIMR